MQSSGYFLKKDGASNDIQLSNIYEDYSDLAGAEFTVTGYIYGFNSEKTYYQVIPVSVETQPYLKAETPDAIAAAETSASIAVKSNVDWTVTCSESWITDYTKSGSKDGNVEITFNANTGDTRTATFTISAEGCTPVSVTLTQNSSDTPASVVLTFPDENKDNNKKGDYVSKWTAKSGEYTWEINSFNNNSWNNNWAYIKCGSKKAATVATIATATPIPNKVTKVIVTFDNISASDKIKSASLIVASDAEYATVLETVPMTLENASAVAKEYVVSSPAEGAYYKLVFDMAQTGNNGTIQISKIEYVRSK